MSRRKMFSMTYFLSQLARSIKMFSWTCCLSCGYCFLKRRLVCSELPLAESGCLNVPILRSPFFIRVKIPPENGEKRPEKIPRTCFSSRLVIFQLPYPSSKYILGQYHFIYPGKADRHVFTAMILKSETKLTLYMSFSVHINLKSILLF